MPLRPVGAREVLPTTPPLRFAERFRLADRQRAQTCGCCPSATGLVAASISAGERTISEKHLSGSSATGLLAAALYTRQKSLSGCSTLGNLSGHPSLVAPQTTTRPLPWLFAGNILQLPSPSLPASSGRTLHVFGGAAVAFAAAAPEPAAAVDRGDRCGAYSRRSSHCFVISCCCRGCRWHPCRSCGSRHRWSPWVHD